MPTPMPQTRPRFCFGRDVRQERVVELQAGLIRRVGDDEEDGRKREGAAAEHGRGRDADDRAPDQERHAPAGAIGHRAEQRREHEDDAVRDRLDQAEHAVDASLTDRSLDEMREEQRDDAHREDRVRQVVDDPGGDGTSGDGAVLSGDTSTGPVHSSQARHYPRRERIFLVHHADAVGPDVDPQRPLSTLGRQQAERWRFKLEGARAACRRSIWHSGKLRARQTAEAMLRVCSPFAEFKMMRGLRPDDPPEWMRDVLSARRAT